jgi:pSer/pThr/pTyr-binding forkhead associated (FHA) protein
MLKDQTTVGRGKDNDVVIKDLHVSSRHAKMVSRKDGVFEILDLNSSGGTYVNGDPVQRKELASGDLLVFGTVAAVFKYVAGSQLDDELEIEGTLVEPKADAARKLEKLKDEKRRGLLTVFSADGNNTIVHVKSEITVGRAPDNDLVINDIHVSSNHARLLCSGGGIFEVFDLRSTCGTFVNGAPVKEKLLTSGDRIRFGLVECEFQIIETHPGGSMNEGAPPPAFEKEELRPGIKPPEKTVDLVPEPKPAAALPKQERLLRRPEK